MRHTSRTSIVDAHVRAASDLMAVARENPRLLREISRRREELLPRFAAYYIQLRALPRRVRRALQRQWHLPLAGVALMLALGQSPALAATIQVGGSCTLVGAITAANADTATGGCPAGNGPDTIVLPVGSTQTLTSVHNSTYGPTGLPVISSVITIVGQGSTIRRASGAPEFRLLAVSSTGDLTLQETTVSGGSVVDGSGGGVSNSGTLTVLNSTISGNAASGGPFCYDYCYTSGGGVHNTGTLTMTNSTISGNSSGSFYSPFYSQGGGGVTNFGTLTMTNSTISGNSSYSFNAGGGGVRNFGTCIVTNSTISGNFASFNYGGGVKNYGTLTVTNSTISGNSSDGGGGLLNSGTLTVTNSTISGNLASYRGAGVQNFGTLTMTNSTISGNEANQVGGGGVSNGSYFHPGGTLTMANSTISGNAGYSGGGVSNFGTLTVTNSTISGNDASNIGNGGGGVENFGTLTMTNSTISGNYAYSGGGVANHHTGTLTMTNSTISGNATYAGDYGGRGGGVRNDGTLILARTLVSGNTAPTGPEMFNYVTYGGTVVANNHNLFGVNGTAGVVGFSPGPTDLVPPAGVQLSNILNPVLAFNGGPTETHALVPGSLAIDAGGPVCLDPNGNPLLTDQRGKPRIVDGNGDGTSRCDIGAFEFFPVVNNFVTLAPGLDTAFDSTPVPGGPAGTFTIGAIFTNTSSTPLRFPFFTVTELSGANLLLNAEEGARGVGATITPNVGDQVLSPGETVAVDFVIGLQAPRPFTFFVDLFGEPLVSGSSTVRQRPNVSTKGVRR